MDLRERAYRVVSRTLEPRGIRQRLVRRAHLLCFRVTCETWGRGREAAARLFLTPAERRLAADFADADLVVITGGTYLVEHYDFTSRLFALETARRLRRPLVFFTQSLGPLEEAGHSAGHRAGARAHRPPPPGPRLWPASTTRCAPSTRRSPRRMSPPSRNGAVLLASSAAETRFLTFSLTALRYLTRISRRTWYGS